MSKTQASNTAREATRSDPNAVGTPAVGDIVFYHTDFHAQDVQKKPTILPAMVVWVNKDGSLNLCVFTDEGTGVKVQRNVPARGKDLVEDGPDPNTYSATYENPPTSTKEDDKTQAVLPTARLTSITREKRDPHDKEPGAAAPAKGATEGKAAPEKKAKKKKPAGDEKAEKKPAASTSKKKK